MRDKGYMRKGAEVFVRDMSSANWELYAEYETEEIAQTALERLRGSVQTMIAEGN